MRPVTALLVGAALVALPTVATAQDFEKTKIVTHAARGPVHMLEGMGGNIGVTVGPDGVLLIDDQFAPLAPKIRRALEALGAKDAPAFILNTHFHGDHVGGNVVFGKDAPIIAHANVRRRMSTRQERRGKVTEPAPAHALPDITHDGGLTIHFNGEALVVRHFPHAHTDGDSTVWFSGSHVMHMGDLYFNGRLPFVDLDSGGSVGGVLSAVEAILKTLPEDAVVIPGHGPISDVKGLTAYRDFLAETVGLVREGKAAGKTLEALQKAGLPAKYAPFAWKFVSSDAWIAAIWRSLEREPARGHGGHGGHGGHHAH